MTSENGMLEELATFLYKLETVRRVRGEADVRHGTALHGMLLTEEADGKIAVNGHRYVLQRQQVYLFERGAEVRLQHRSDIPLNGYYLEFQALRESGDGHYSPARMRSAVHTETVHARQLLGMAEEAANKLDGTVWSMLEANVRFQEMMALLLKDMRRAGQRDLKKAVYWARDYIEQNYERDMTRERLAEIAGLNPDYFSRAFKRQFQKSPLTYLNDVRIHQAKKLLVQTSESIRSIARSVGFSDEFYFSRKFKSNTGSSPAAYVKQIKHEGKIASLNHLITGHLIALGQEPHAAIINSSFPVSGQLSHTIAIGRRDADLDRLVEVRPDLIVTRGSRYIEQSPKDKILSQIAPTITLPYTESWRSHFMAIAGFIGRDREARGWLERYESKAEEMGRQIKRRIGDEAFLVLGIGEGKMCVYGQRNIGTVLYHDLKLTMPEKANATWHYSEISLEELPTFQADRILLTIFRQDNKPPSEPAIRSQLRVLYSSKEWQSLPAVRNGRVYGMYDSQHLYTSYNPLSHELFLHKFTEMLLGEH